MTLDDKSNQPFAGAKDASVQDNGGNSTPTASGNTRTSQTLARGLMLLNCFRGETGQELGIKDLVQKLGLAQTIVSRLTSTLVEYGYLHQNKATRKYRLGLAAATLGLVANPYLELKEAAQPWMDKLAEQTGETISLTVIDPASEDGVCVASIDSPNQIKLTTVVGSVRPLYKGATRKVLLAYLPHSRQMDYVARLGLDAGEQRDLEQELNQIRQQGYAYSEQELDKDAFAIAVPILTADGILLGGLAVLGPLFRHQEKEIHAWIDSVRRAAKMTAKSVKG